MINGIVLEDSDDLRGAGEDGLVALVFRLVVE